MLASQKIVQLVEKLRCMRAKDGVPTAEANQQTCRPAAYNALLVYRAFYPPQWGDSPQTKEWKSDGAGGGLKLF